MTNYEIEGLRLAIGIQSTGFELTRQDYFELYQFDVPDSREAFLKSCDKVKAQYPSAAQFSQLQQRYLNDTDELYDTEGTFEVSPEEEAAYNKRAAEFDAKNPGRRKRSC